MSNHFSQRELLWVSTARARHHVFELGDELSHVGHRIADFQTRFLYIVVAPSLSKAAMTSSVVIRVGFSEPSQVKAESHQSHGRSQLAVDKHAFSPDSTTFNSLKAVI